MSNVFQLPDPGHSSWRVYEGVLRDAMTEAGADPSEVEHVVDAVRVVYLRYAKHDQIVAEGDPVAAFNDLNAWVRSVCSGLIAGLAAAELRAYRAERSKPG